MKAKVIAGKYSVEDSRLIARELNEIQKKQSVITPQVVVQSASRKDSPLRKYFEWDDTEAAQRYRLWQARMLIASVWVADSEDAALAPVRAFVNVQPEIVDDLEDEELAGRGYVFTPSIQSNAGYKKQVLNYARQQLIGWRTRFGNFAEFLHVTKEIDKLK